MAVIEVDDGSLLTQDSTEVLVYRFNWDDELEDGVGISDSSFTLTLLNGAASPALTQDNDTIVTGARSTQVRLSTLPHGALYRIDNTIVTDESPTQTFDRHFKLLGQQK